MTQTGGPAALNGFLYQILHHIGWLAEVSLSRTLNGSKIQDACLVLEPRNGGDAQAKAPGIYLVEQYKTRSDRTWSIAEIVSILSDLRKALPSSQHANARYRFVTDGRPGRLDLLNNFLTDVKSARGPDDLDQARKKTFGKGLIFSNREFFDHIVSTTRAVGWRPTGDEQRDVFHLLKHFEMEFDSSASAQAVAVEKWIRRHAPDLGDERGIRERLVGKLVEILSKGEARLDSVQIDTILRDAGLSIDRPYRLAGLAETLEARLHSRLENHLRYQLTRDVRPPPDWPQNKPVLLIAGASGAGKTWQLGRLLEQLSQLKEIATLVLGCTTREAVLADAARDIWQVGLGETSEKSLIAVSHFLRDSAADPRALQITVAVDDVQDIDLARALIRHDWVEWNMRLVLTVPLAIARSLEISDRSSVQVHRVGDFSIDELDRLLKNRERSWTDLPPDLKRLLRNPILAGIFLEPPYRSVQQAPQSEYEIFEGFWARIAVKGRAGDEGLAIALALSFVNGCSYPLPRQNWLEIGLTDEVLARLDAAGWFRVDESGAVAFTHDRLLNWAAAKALVWRYWRRELATEKLVELLSKGGSEAKPSIKQRLRYMAMDALWLLAENQQSEKLGTIIAGMEDSREFGSYGEELYANLLPTLGQRAVPILLERLNAVISAGRGDYRVNLIARAFVNLARQDHVRLKEAIGVLLDSVSRDNQSVAIAALKATPDATFLDRLWEIHQNRTDALEDKSKGTWHGDYTESFAALRSGVAQNPEWLRKRILAADPKREHVSELGYVLNSLEHADAPAIWRDAGETLMVKVPVNKPRSLLYCIARFIDRTKQDFVVRSLSQSEDYASGAALQTLSILDPRAAIERLMEVDEAERYLSRNNWLPGLLRAEPDLTRKHVLLLAHSHPKGRRTIEMLFDQHQNELDEAMLMFVLRSLEEDLYNYFNTDPGGDPDWLFHPLRFLREITNPDLLAVLASEAGGELERMITVVACSRLNTNSNCVDHIREDARKVLILICGDGISTLLIQELGSEHHWVRHGGLRWAFLRNEDGIIRRLAAIARRPLPRDANGKFESEPYGEFLEAISALVALGADSDLVSIIHDGGVAEFPVDVARLRMHGGPMPKVLTQNALQTLTSGTATDGELLAVLVIAWMSADASLVPAVRGVLKNADPAGKLAGYACIALGELGDQSDEFALLAYSLAQTKENVRWGLDGLANLGDRGVKLLAEWLNSPDLASRAEFQDFVIRVLYAHPATREAAIIAACASCHRGQHFRGVPYDIAAEADDSTLRDQIVDKAFASHSIFVTETLRAIEGLAKFDAARAAEAIKLALNFYPSIERELCRLLIRLVPETAGAELIRVVMSSDRDSLRDNVGRGLRRIDPSIISPLLLDCMKGTASERKAAAQLAAWLPIPMLAEALGHLADRDSESKVRHAALLALEWHRKEHGFRMLFEEFRAPSCERRWTLLVAILEAADPYLLTDRSDPLWLGNILSDDIPAAFAWHSEKALRQRKQKNR